MMDEERVDEDKDGEKRNASVIMHDGAGRWRRLHVQTALVRSWRVGMQRPGLPGVSVPVYTYLHTSLDYWPSNMYITCPIRRMMRNRRLASKTASRSDFAARGEERNI